MRMLKIGTIIEVSNQDLVCSKYTPKRNSDSHEFTGDVVEGVFGSESAWPEVGATNFYDASKEVTAIAAATGLFLSL